MTNNEASHILRGLKRYYNEARPKGEWISKPLVYGVTYCSECDFELKINNTNYCPNCGARMTESEDKE